MERNFAENVIHPVWPLLQALSYQRVRDGPCECDVEHVEETPERGDVLDEVGDGEQGTLILLVQAEGSFFSRSHFLRTIHFTYAPKNHKRSTKISMILVRCHTLRDFHKRSLFLRWL